MNQNMNLTSVILVLCLALVGTICAAADCKPEVTAMEVGLKKVLFLSDEVKPPKTNADYNAFCRAAKESIKTVKKSSNCFNPFPKQLFTIIATTGQKVVGQLCGRKANRPAILKEIRCLNEKVVESMNDCFYDFSRQLSFIQANVTDAELFPHLCCSIHSLSKCLYKNVHSTCGEGNEEAAKFIQDIINSVLADAKNFLCAKTPNVEHCIKSEAKVMKSLDIARKSGSNVFFVGPFVKLADRLVA